MIVSLIAQRSIHLRMAHQKRGA